MATKKRRSPRRVTAKKTIHLTITKIKGGRISITETHPKKKRASKKRPAKKRRKKALPPAPF